MGVTLTLALALTLTLTLTRLTVGGEQEIDELLDTKVVRGK